MDADVLGGRVGSLDHDFGLPGAKELRSLGLPWELRDVRATVRAAQARVVRFEDHGHLHVRVRARRLESLQSRVEHGSMAREAWLTQWRSKAFVILMAQTDRAVCDLLHASPPCGLQMDQRQG